MYATQVGEQRLTLQVSGMLWNRSLVMRDLETKSLWSHILGRSMAGELRGQELEVIPSTMTDWATWQKNHPDTTVANLSRTAKGFRREMYKDPQAFLVGLAEGELARAWTYETLVKQPVVNDSFDDQPVAIFFDTPSGAAQIFSRQVGDQTLTFEKQAGAIIDRETGSHWNWLTGRATDGKLKDQNLTPRKAVISFTKAWKVFHPESEYFRLPGNTED